jgi:hypothetical protein
VSVVAYLLEAADSSCKPDRPIQGHFPAAKRHHAAGPDDIEDAMIEVGKLSIIDMLLAGDKLMHQLAIFHAARRSAH